MLKWLKQIEKNVNKPHLGNVVNGRKSGFNFTKILLSSMWEKSFSNGSTIFVKNKNDDINKLKEATVLKTFSHFGENIDSIDLLIEGKRVSYTMNDNMEYFKKKTLYLL